MAREETTPAQLRAYAQIFQELCDGLSQFASDVEESKVPFVLIHRSTVTNRNIPELWDWIASVEKEVKVQSRAFRDGLKSRAKKSMEDHARRKNAAKKKGK